MKCNTCGKINCYEHGGGVHKRVESGNFAGEGVSKAGQMVRAIDRDKDKPMLADYNAQKRGVAKKEHERVLGESRSMPKPKLKGLAKGGEVDMYAMEPDVPAMHGYEEGGEVDDELVNMACEEFCDAIEKKDKAGIIESLRALVLSMKE